MIFAPLDALPNQPAKYGEASRTPLPHVVYADAAHRTIVHRLDLLYLPLDASGLALRLYEKPRLLIDRLNRGLQVEGWGVGCDLTEVFKLPTLMARRFVELCSWAEAGTLNREEEASWLSILDLIDFQQFHIDRALPHYSEGLVKNRTSHGVSVQWEDGATQLLAPKVAGSLFQIQPGEMFAAYVKLGRDNETIRIERVSLLDEGHRLAA